MAMHEWALAEAVLKSVQDEAAKHEGRVRRVVILFGELQQIDPDIFRGGIEELSRHYAFDPDVFTVTIDPAAFTCLACGSVWGLADQPELGEDANVQAAEKKLLDVTNITREYRETGNFGPYNIYLVVDNTNVTAGATPVGNVLVEIEAHLESEADDDSPGFLSGYTFAAVIAAAAAALPVRKNGNR